MPTARASAPEEMRPRFRVVSILRRFSSASAARMSDTPMGDPPNLFQIFLKYMVSDGGISVKYYFKIF